MDPDLTGASVVRIDGGDAMFRVNGNLYFSENSILGMTVAADGALASVDMLGSGSQVTLANGCSLVVNLSAMTASPDEIILINNTGSSAISGTFSIVLIIGDGSYNVSCTGDTGDDVSLVASD